MSPSQREIVADVAEALRRHAILLRTLNRKLLGGHLSPAQVAVLQFVSERKRATPKEISQFSGLTAGTITSLLDGLEREHYVVRSRSTEDRREVWVTLSDRAAELLSELMRQAQAEVARLFEDWSPEDMQNFTTYLDRLARGAHVEAT